MDLSPNWEINLEEQIILEPMEDEVVLVVAKYDIALPFPLVEHYCSLDPHAIQQVEEDQSPD